MLKFHDPNNPDLRTLKIYPEITHHWNVSEEINIFPFFYFSIFLSILRLYFKDAVMLILLSMHVEYLDKGQEIM